VQVKKFSTVKSRIGWGTYYFSKHRRTAYKKNEVDAFVVHLDGEWFVFSSTVVQRGDGSIPNAVNVRAFLDFRDAWDVLRGAKHITERQLGFDF
jgi:hypothetical protein